ncbi:ROK family protein [Aquisalibacillus elongatus]|uniref:Glucokinase n=1 Tax=Aquisalibacillus elongatus TaxID=485577 RepID=A0A3N5C4B2_9BACI|nr:ROK family protein [Aquisalibacillus elongatus]RPF54292.1 glucokinase [Aquisalibacillus elongatus]
MKTVGIDIGGTKILGVVLNEHGQVLEQKEIPTSIEAGKESILNSLVELTEQLMLDQTVQGIGIGSAGRIDVDEGSVYYATPNLPDWTGVNLKKRIEETFQLPVTVDNDVNVASISEKWIGAAQDLESFVLITIGTGIAASVWVKGELLHGQHWSSGEIGHMILYPNGILCNCGQKGCLEQYVSGSALHKLYNSQSMKQVQNGREFFEQLDEGDLQAQAVLDQFVEDFSVALINLSHTFDPEAFIIGGGLIKTKDYWWHRLIEQFEQNSSSSFKTINLRETRLGTMSSAVGAAKMVMSNI